MYHEGTIFTHSYYDTIEEMPNVAKVYFPDEKEPKEMTAEQVRSLDKDGWYTVMHSVNWGCCDHWTSEKPSKWVRDRFERIVKYVNKDKVVGYNRVDWSIRLTRDAKVWHSEVWNS